MEVDNMSRVRKEREMIWEGKSRGGPLIPSFSRFFLSSSRLRCCFLMLPLHLSLRQPIHVGSPVVIYRKNFDFNQPRDHNRSLSMKAFSSPLLLAKGYLYTLFVLSFPHLSRYVGLLIADQRMGLACWAIGTQALFLSISFSLMLLGDRTRERSPFLSAKLWTWNEGWDRLQDSRADEDTEKREHNRIRLVVIYFYAYWYRLIIKGVDLLKRM